MRDMDEEVAITIADSIHHISGGQCNDGTNTTWRSTIFDNRIIDTLADLSSIGIAEDKFVQRAARSHLLVRRDGSGCWSYRERDLRHSYGQWRPIAGGSLPGCKGRCGASQWMMVGVASLHSTASSNWKPRTAKIRG